MVSLQEYEISRAGICIVPRKSRTWDKVPRVRQVCGNRSRLLLFRWLPILAAPRLPRHLLDESAGVLQRPYLLSLAGLVSPAAFWPASFTLRQLIRILGGENE